MLIASLKGYSLMQTMRVAHLLNTNSDQLTSLEIPSSKRLTCFRPSLTSNSAISESILSALDAALPPQTSILL